jgi:hypothetical protein
VGERQRGEAPLVARLIVAADAKLIPVVRQRLQDAIHEIQRDLSCDDEPAVAPDQYTRWAITLAFAPVAPVAPAPRRGRRRG